MAVRTYAELGIDLPSDWDTKKKAWHQVNILSDELTAYLGGVSRFYFKGDWETIDAAFKKMYNTTPGQMFCPCRYCDDIVQINSFATDERLTIEKITLFFRNGMLDRQNREMQSRQPSYMYSTPVQREQWANARPYRTMDNFMYNDSKTMFFTDVIPDEGMPA